MRICLLEQVLSYCVVCCDLLLRLPYLAVRGVVDGEEVEHILDPVGR